MPKSNRGDAAAAKAETAMILAIVGGKLSEHGPDRGGYSATIAVPWGAFDADALEKSLLASAYPISSGLGLRAITRERLSIDSPGRGFARRKDWGRAFSSRNVVPALYGFGQQLAAIEAYGGEIRRIELHVLAPPVGRSVVGWSIR